MTHLIGRHLEGYRIVEQIHGGSQESSEPPEAEIYRAATLDGRRSVAVKVFALPTSDAGRLQRLSDGLTVVSRLKCPGVPEILGSGAIDGRPYVVMPYFAAGSLADRLSSGMAFSLDAGELLNQVATVLSQAHRRRVVHGDLKPSKLLFDESSGMLHMIGLGEAAARTAPRDQLATAGAVYAAPELQTGADPGPASDQYAFGALALELLARADPAEAMGALRGGSVAKQDLARLGVSQETVLVLAKATAVDPGQRFADLAEANRALQISIGNVQPVVEAAPDPEPSSPPPGRRRKPRRLRFGLAAAFILLLALAGAIPAYSFGLITLPDFSQENPNPTGSALSGGDVGLLLPAPTPTEWLGESDPAGEGGAPTEAASDPATGQPTDDAVASTTLDVDPNPTPVASPTPTQVQPTATDPPAPTATSQPTDTPPPTSTSAPVDPTTNPKACKDDPSHPNYCTPTP